MTRATVTIKTHDDRQKIAVWASNVEPGTVVTFRKKSRSTEQSAKMWAMLREVSDQVEWYGQKLEDEDWKDIFTASLRHARVVPGIDKGTFVPLGMRTSTLTIEEMSNLIELIYAFGAEHGVVFKEPKHINESGNSSQPDKADVDRLSASAEPAGFAPEPAGSPNLIDCARELLALSISKFSSDEERTEVLMQTKDEWSRKLPEYEEHIGSILISAKAVASGKRKIEQARTYLSEVLDCSVADLGGKADG